MSEDLAGLFIVAVLRVLGFFSSCGSFELVAFNLGRLGLRLLSPPLPLPLPLHFPRPRPLPRPPSSASFALMVNCFCRVAVSLVSCPAEQKMGSQKVEV